LFLVLGQLQWQPPAAVAAPALSHQGATLSFGETGTLARTHCEALVVTVIVYAFIRTVLLLRCVEQQQSIILMQLAVVPYHSCSYVQQRRHRSRQPRGCPRELYLVHKGRYGTSGPVIRPAAAACYYSCVCHRTLVHSCVPSFSHVCLIYILLGVQLCTLHCMDCTQCTSVM
jgi:hypothetical protein